MTAPAHVHVTHGMNMGKMVGPLPMGAWVVIIGGGLTFALYTRHAQVATSAANAQPSSPASSLDASGGVGVGGSGMWTDVTPPSTTGNTGAPTNNDQWEIAAVDYLIAKGYDPGLSDSAIRKWFGGAKLSITEYALVREALLRFGEPPSPLPAPLYDPPSIVPTVPPPISVPGIHQPPPIRPPTHAPAPKPAIRHYTVTTADRASGLWGIATRFYHNPLRWKDIYNANRAVIGPNPNIIKPGQILILPA